MIQRTDALPIFRKVGIKKRTHFCAVGIGLGWVLKIHIRTLVRQSPALGIRARTRLYN